MSHRLQVLVPEALESKIRKAAQRLSMSQGAWVRRAIEQALAGSVGGRPPAEDPLLRLASLEAPTGDIGCLLEEIDAGRS